MSHRLGDPDWERRLREGEMDSATGSPWAAGAEHRAVQFGEEGGWWQVWRRGGGGTSQWGVWQAVGNLGQASEERSESFRKT